MEAEIRRSIRSGKEYDHLFPFSKGEHLTILKDADVSDTLALIQKTVPLTLKDTQKISQVLQGSSLEQTCENIWNFVYNHIQYKRDDKGIEQVRRPARSWWDRQTGVDCDCYTEFISSILSNLGIAHKLRITKYNGKSYFQHIYPIVPIDGNLNKALTFRTDYIVIDCVKDAFNQEQQFTDFKDYQAMRLDYLNGFDESVGSHENTDIGDLSSLQDDKELNGKFGNWLKKAGGTVKKGLRFLNRFTNPGTIMLRNGFLLGMKTNFLRLAARIRYAYLSDEQASAMGMNMSAFQKLKKVKDKAEDIYYQAGGKKENLKKAILGGKGNKDKKVPMNGFETIDGLDELYADQQEYNIIHKGSIDGLDGENELGVVATASIASAMTVLSAVGGALSQVKGLFKKNTPEAQQFDQASASNGSGNETSNESDQTSKEDSLPSADSSSSAAVLNQSKSSRMASSNDSALVKSQDQSTSDPSTQEQGVFAKTTSWIKENPGKSLLITGAIIGAGFMILKKKAPPTRKVAGNLNGVAKTRKKKRNAPCFKSKITTIEI